MYHVVRTTTDQLGTALNAALADSTAGLVTRLHTLTYTGGRDWVAVIDDGQDARPITHELVSLGGLVHYQNPAEHRLDARLACGLRRYAPGVTHTHEMQYVTCPDCLKVLNDEQAALPLERSPGATTAHPELVRLSEWLLANEPIWTGIPGSTVDVALELLNRAKFHDARLGTFLDGLEPSPARDGATGSNVDVAIAIISSHLRESPAVSYTMPLPGRNGTVLQDVYLPGHRNKNARDGKLLLGTYEEGDGSYGGWLEDAHQTWIVYFWRSGRPALYWPSRDPETHAVLGAPIELP